MPRGEGAGARPRQMEWFDPHFHIWDVRENGLHDPALADMAPGLYAIRDYEADLQHDGVVKLVGGVYVEAMSACFPDTPARDHQAGCVREAQWTRAQLNQSALPYGIVATACLEDPDVERTLEQLVAVEGMRGIRQIVNHEPSWPRCKKEDLLKNPRFSEGFAKLARFNLSFELHLNPHQYPDGHALVVANPGVSVILDHLGCATWEDLTAKAQHYWHWMEKFAACENVSLKISMLWYAHKDWDSNDVVIDAVRRAIRLFGSKRCFFASNFPVDLAAAGGNCSPKRLVAGLLKIAEPFGDEEKQDLFVRTARKVYRCD